MPGTAQKLSATVVTPLKSVLCGEPRPDFLRDELLPEIFATTATAFADKTALIEADARLTYAALDRRADALARGLAAKGIGRGHVVGLWLMRGIDLLVAQLAITKTGAAWLPFDADVAIERIATCLSDCGATALMTSPALRDRAQGIVPQDMWVEAELALAEGAAVGARARGTTPDDPAYLIYTSGSTGMPKGIVVSHRNICHYLRSANEVYGIGPDDIAFQGCSAAFDLSMEEIWVPYLVGATLWVATPAVMAETERLPEVLEAAGVTVLDTVPTLLGLVPRDIASLRVIILGGEACPPSLAARWCRPGRTLFNSYGPTEATVVATVDTVEPDEPITIGRPIPNYTAYVVDAELNLVPPGEQGELLIGGPGVAQGYLQRPDLTAAKFIVNPFGMRHGDPILYRSGDAVSLSADGKLQFHGRIDDQVKIRGFRVELGEIEAKLTALAGIGQAAVVLRKDDGIERLVAFLVTTADAGLDTPAVRSALARTLPAYMIPARFEAVDALPRLSSGKIDRKTLQARPLAAAASNDVQEDAETPTEAVLLSAAQKIFPGQTIPFSADFFTELGGHSLIAAKFISIVRETPRYAGIMLQDVYEGRSLRGIAERLDARGYSDTVNDLSFEPPPFWRRFWCGVAQAAALPVVLFLMTVQWLGVFTAFLMMDTDSLGFCGQALTLGAIYIGMTVATSLIGIAAKWLILGRTKPGRYPLWGAYYYRVWLAAKFNLLVRGQWLQGTPLMRVYMRMMGAKVGKDAIISSFDAGATDLIEIGDRVCTGTKLKFANVQFVRNEMIIGTCKIEDDAYVGTSAVIEYDTVIGAGAEVGDIAAVLQGERVGAWEKWEGTPARKVGLVDRAGRRAYAEASPLRKFMMTLGYLFGLVVIPPIGILPVFPAFWVFDHIDDFISDWTTADTIDYLFALAFPTALVLIVITVLLTIAMRWIILPTRLKPGAYSVHSGTYFRKWMLALITEIKLETLSSIYATVFMRWWYQAMGTKVGKGAEISTNLSGRYDLVEIGEKNFVADEVLLGDEEIRSGYMILEPVKTAARVFLGNSSVVPPGTTVEEDALLGILSTPPASKHIGKGETWFGSPPIKLPTRQKIGNVDAMWTYEPSIWRNTARAIFEAIVASIPSALFIAFGYYTVDYIDPMIDQGQWLSILGVFVVASCAVPAIMTAITIAIKWSMMGVYKPTMKPMWSFWAMRTERIAVLYWGLAGRVMLESLRGTPFLPWVLKLYGTKIGKGVCLNTTDMTEFDCVKIGDYCTINALSALQTHLYEDRLMKIGRIELGKGVNIGAGATVLYDSKVGDFVDIGALSVIMKGESLPAHSSWVGAPAQPGRADATARAVPAPTIVQVAAE